MSDYPWHNPSKATPAMKAARAWKRSKPGLDISRWLLDAFMAGYEYAKTEEPKAVLLPAEQLKPDDWIVSVGFKKPPTPTAPQGDGE